ncbi:L7Ae/L30e/S12e/Gadd45 family ribosomal protein [Eupransor demetentiae]|uniref:Ribosomal protein L7Ae or related RNA K-turn-binding protein (Rpl7Ae) n=1 Tax=Eupransor demetentiae TaxID=3109584 RepID=A0ABM9N4I2_9LACO|nr:Ribosomal protein L7Ae or related RNA K-turn-binding protein (Rpl7Ae) [Lactobacillaceae bacterium LMG 33000]
MEPKKQILNLFGLAQKAGKLVLGSGPTLDAIRQNKVQLVFFPSDGGVSQAKKFQDKTTFYQVAFNQDFSRAELTQALGVNRSVFGINDRGFSRKIKQLLLEEKERN